MNFFGRARLALNKIKDVKNSSSGQSNVVSDSMAALIFFGIVILLAPILTLTAVFVTNTSDFGYDMSMMQAVEENGTSSSSSRSGVNLNYDFEDYYNASQQAVEGVNSTSELKNSSYGSVEQFNQHIKDSVKAAGWGTREGVVAAGMALVGDYIKATGRRLKYDQGTRQTPGIEGLKTDSGGSRLDCSGFAAWALYNGGFKLAPGVRVQTDYLYNWARQSGYTSDDIASAKPGDYFVTKGKGHIILVVGTFDGGYYCAEEVFWGVGAKISKRYIKSLGSYALINMDKYYSDPNNVRPET